MKRYEVDDPCGYSGMEESPDGGRVAFEDGDKMRRCLVHVASWTLNPLDPITSFRAIQDIVRKTLETL